MKQGLRGMDHGYSQHDSKLRIKSEIQIDYTKLTENDILQLDNYHLFKYCSFVIDSNERNNLRERIRYQKYHKNKTFSRKGMSILIDFKIGKIKEYQLLTLEQKMQEKRLRERRRYRMNQGITLFVDGNR